MKLRKVEAARVEGRSVADAVRDIGVLDRLIAQRGAPAFIWSDNGPEFVANAVRSHLSDLDVETRVIAPGAPWENGYVERLDGTLRNELLSRDIFGHLLEARVLGEQCRQEYNTGLTFTLVQTAGAAQHPAAGLLFMVWFLQCRPIGLAKMPTPVFAEGLSYIRLVARHTLLQYGQIRFEPHLPVSALVLCLPEQVTVCPPEGGASFLPRLSTARAAACVRL
jgi:hypothetical protein